MLLKRLSEFNNILLEAFEPLSIFGAQVLYVAQPTLSLFIDRERITAWAELLEDPEQLARLSEPSENETYE